MQNNHHVRKLIVAEDHAILREGLKMLLSIKPDLQIVDEASDGLEAVQKTTLLKPDLLIMDLGMPKMNGIEAIKEIRGINTNIKIVVLTAHESEEYIEAAFEAGADGYVLKDSTHSELLSAIEAVFAGKQYLSPAISSIVIHGYLAKKGKVGDKPSQADTLSPREKTVLKLIAEGYTNKQIGEMLYISPKTVDNHRTNLMRKLDIHKIHELIKFAIKKRIISQ